MHKVFTPRRASQGWGTAILGAVLTTIAVFLVLPLTQLVSSSAQKKYLLSKVDVAMPTAPPPSVEPPPPPPPPQEKPDEPKPELAEQPQPMSLSQLDLDISVGTGGALASGIGQFQEAAQAVQDLAVFDVADLDRPPELIASVSPIYPQDLRKARVEGQVVIVFVLDESGKVEDPRVESASRPEFERPAVEALRRWKFKPGQKEGQAVRTYMRLPMRFKIGS